MERLIDGLLDPGEVVRAEAGVVLAVDRSAPGRGGRRKTTRRRLGERHLVVTDRRLLLLAVDVRGRPGELDRELLRDDVRIAGVAGGIAPVLLLARRSAPADDVLVLAFPVLRRRAFRSVADALGLD